MKRRGFLGMLGGAAVAGPAAMKQAASSALPLNEAQLAQSLMSAGNIGYGAQSVGLFDKASRVAKLKRLISGDEQEDRHPIETARVKQIKAEGAVMALVSVSRSQKINILQRRLHAIEQERDKAWWLMELLGLEAS